MIDQVVYFKKTLLRLIYYINNGTTKINLKIIIKKDVIGSGMMQYFIF